MGLTVPNLDDKRFNDIVDEARLLIARFAPQWTDYNVHDPGITFIELFAWLAEMQIYQLNRVTDANYHTFFKLVGLEPFPAQPARVDITFEGVREERIIKEGELFTTTLGTEKVVFVAESVACFTREEYEIYLREFPHVEEILRPLQRMKDNKICIDLTTFPGEAEKALGTRAFQEIKNHVIDHTLIPVTLTSIMTRYNSQTFDNTQANQKNGIDFAPFGEGASEDAALFLKFDRLLPEKDITLTFYLFEDDLPAPGRFADEDGQVISSVTLSWEYTNGDFKSEEWEPLPVKMDDTESMTRSGRVILSVPPSLQEKKDAWIRCRIKEGKYEIVPRVSMILLNTIPAVQIETKNESLSSRPGAGFPNQRIPLDKPVIKGTLRIEIQQKDGNWEVWKEVRDFDASGPNDSHYMFDPEKGEVLFGNGLNGRIPLEWQQMKALYKTTLGARGNISQDNRFFLDGISGYNKKAAIGGRDDESIEHAKDRAKKAFRTRYRAITSDDYEELALSTPGLRVARAKAIPNYHPDFPDAKIPGVVTVVAVPFVRFANRKTVQPPRTITAYKGSTKVAVLDKAWEIKPDNTIKYQISIQHDGTAQGATASTITLSATASDNNGAYNGLQILITGGKGVCQQPRKITAYDGNKKIATVNPDWDIIPDNTSAYRIGNLEGTIRGITGLDVTLSPNASGVSDAYKDFQIEIVDNTTPVIGKGFRRTIENHLNDRRLITTDLYVIGPEYVRISVRCKIYIRRKSSPEKVEDRVRKALDEFLDPFRGGPEKSGWPFGRAVFPSEIYQLIDKQEGVNYVTDVVLYATGKYRKRGETIEIPENGLTYPGSHTLKIEEDKGSGTSVQGE